MNQISTNQVSTKPLRLQGLDLARYIALVGMVFVNFGVVMVSDTPDGGESSWSVALLQGRAAATFVVLAGVGLGLSAYRKPWRSTFTVTLKRVAFLLFLGLLNMLVFDADIIHFYAFYFMFGVFFLPAPAWGVWLGIVSLVMAQFVMVINLNYDAGWDWQAYTYEGFWTPAGFARNLFFNGWHPVIPWLAFLLFGILISRIALSDRRIQWRLCLAGIVVFAATMIVSTISMAVVKSTDAEAALLFTTAPIPPMPLYIIAGGSIACAVIGLCLLVESKLAEMHLLDAFTAAGRQTLTLYIAHILIGMGVLESLGMIGGQTSTSASIASVVFCVVATGFAVVWSRFFKRGPLESVMRKLAG